MGNFSWQDRAAAKRAETLNRIYPEWRLSAKDLEHARQQRDITGAFIEQFLNEGDVSITSMKSAPILTALRERKLSAVQVATAFCKRAAVAHQIVRSSQQLSNFTCTHLLI
jgi:amidase